MKPVLIAAALQSRRFTNLLLIKNAALKKITQSGMIIILLLATSATLSAQTNITGKVTSASGAPLAGASVNIKGTNNGTTTNDQGSYAITARSNDTLVISFIGYIQQEIAVSGRSSIDVVMNEEASSLEQVVVVGYGTQKKLAVTGAVSEVKGDILKKSPVANISSSLAGNVAGISMRPTGAQPGADAPEIHIRGIGTTGNNAPLVVIDGIIRDNINEIDPNDVATISVLKDAAAVAPYGLGGANGVILITTKKGQSGAPTLSFNGYYGYQTPTYIPKMLNAADYMRLRNEAYLNENPGGSQLPFAEDLINDYGNLHAQDPDKYPDSDIRDIMHIRAPIQNYNLRLSGGAERIKYYLGVGYIDQDGMLSPVNFRRYNYNINVEAKATRTTTVTASLIGAVEKARSIDPGGSMSGFFRSLFKFIPVANLTYSNGLPGSFASNAPAGVLNAGYVRRNSNTLLTTLSIEQQLPFVKGLSLKGTFSYDPYSSTVKSWHTPSYFYSQNTTVSPYEYTKQVSTGDNAGETYSWLSQEYMKSQSFTYQLYLNYDNTFGKHHFTGLVVGEARNNTYEEFMARRNRFAVDIDELSLGSSDRNDFDNAGVSSTGSQMGLVYRAGYDFDNKYLLEASGRYDGHYYFAPGKRWAYFPAFSAGWVISREDFFKVSFIDHLKIRGSWGKSGNLAGYPFQYLNAYDLYSNAYAFGNGRLVQGSFIPQEANPDITWEVATKTDIGIEANLWKGLLHIEADYFHERRKGMLLPPAVSVPVEYGLDLSDENAGIMENNGVELTLSSAHQFKNGLRLGLSANFSYAKNKMIQVFETPATLNNPNRSRTGRPLGTQFGYHALGLFGTADDKNSDGVIDADDGYTIEQFGELHPGDIRYADIGGPDGTPDGVIDAYDETVIGHPISPFITYGFTPTASWKSFDLSLFFQGAALANLDMRGYQTIPFANNNSNSSYVYYNNRWTPGHQNARYPRANQAPYANNDQLSDFWIMGIGYMRLKTAVLGYTIPASLTKRINIQSVRVYVSGQNIFTVSKLKWIDPEIWRDPDQEYADRAMDYPPQKVFTVGLNVTF